MYIYFFETLLYLTFAFTGGYLLLQFIPERAKPDIRPLTALFQYALLCLPLFSFMSIWRTTLVLREYAQSLSVFEVLVIVLKDYVYGNAWVWLLILCTFMYSLTLFASMARKSVRLALAIGWVLGVGVQGWASHPASFSLALGLASQVLHVAAMSLWLGTLFIIAWFSRGSLRWPSFVKWFSPLSVASVLFIIAGGLAMMSLIVDNYVNSWAINYGQALLLKHLMFVPLLVLGFMNGFLSKMTRGGQQEGRLLWWLRLETVIALAIMYITAYMGVQEPPHEGELKPPSPSPLFELLHGNADMPLQWTWNAAGIVYIFIGIAAAGLMLSSYKSDNRKLFVSCAIIAPLFPFFGLLLSVQ